MKAGPSLAIALLAAMSVAQETVKRESADAQRRAIKLAIDRGVSGISRKERPTTIAALKSLPRPKGLADDISTPAYQNRRLAPLETTRWRVTLRLTEVSLHKDGDIYLVATDGTGHRLVLECPDPEEARRSVLRREIARSRAAIIARFHPGKSKKAVDVEATIVALGYWGKAKAGDNGARLQPILSVRFR